MEGNSKLAPSPVRLPQDLKDWLKHQAINNHRSMNSEVVARLEESRTRQSSPQQPSGDHPSTDIMSSPRERQLAVQQPGK